MLRGATRLPGWGKGTVDQTGRQAQLCAQIGLPGCHLTLVGLMIQTGEVEQAMEDEDADLGGEGMAEVLGLARGGVE